MRAPSSRCRAWSGVRFSARPAVLASSALIGKRPELLTSYVLAP
jgi:hypothetical protein